MSSRELPGPSGPVPPESGRDLRLPLLGVAAWIGALLGALVPGSPHRWPAVAALAMLVAGAGASMVRRGVGGQGRRTIATGMLVLVAAAAIAGLRAGHLRENPLADLAQTRAVVEVTGSLTTDPKAVSGAGNGAEGSAREVVRLGVTSVTGRGTTYRLRAPLVVVGTPAWADVPAGAVVSATGRLAPADDASALLSSADPPQILRRPAWWWRAAERLRGEIRAAVAERPGDQAALVPALVDGDVATESPAMVEDFRATGLTHLTAVSGTNLTLVVGFALLVARWVGVRGRGLYVVAGLGIVGFVLLARAEPSVLRAAAMGTVGLLALGHNGRQRALRGLGAAVLGLVLIDPGLSRSVGFALSAMATAGIVLLAPGWRDALARWMPSWAAEAIAVPAAAQLACTPVIAAISGQVSLVAVVANLLVEPVVAPATVLGLLGGIAGLVCAPLGRLIATPAGWCVGWILTVARHGAALPKAGIGWGSGAVALTVLTVVVAVVAFGAPRLLRRPVFGVGCCLVLLAVMTIRLPVPGWPPAGWVFAMCDVGQGDGLVLDAGPHAAVVIDAGPDATRMETCLDGLGVTRVPLALFTHFDADHVSGAPAVFHGRRVDAVWTTQVQQPPAGVAKVGQTAGAGGVRPVVAPWGRSVTIGTLSLQVLWPRTDLPLTGSGSQTNQASVVVLVRSAGLSLLLTGDLEPDSAAAVAREVPGLHVDVLKVAHHGSRYQDFDWLAELRPAIALISVGAHNTYGHPARETLAALQADGARVYRTDQDGTMAVLPGAQGPVVVAR